MKMPITSKTAETLDLWVGNSLGELQSVMITEKVDEKKKNLLLWN